jgi:hypothetical protein
MVDTVHSLGTLTWHSSIMALMLRSTSRSLSVGKYGKWRDSMIVS